MSTSTTLPTQEALSPSVYADDPTLIRVGMGATYATALGGYYSAYTIVAVRKGGRELDVQRDKVTRITPGNPWQDDGEKEYTPNPSAEVETYTLRKNGTFIKKGQPMERWASTLRVGYRRDWIDLSQ